MVSYMKVLDIFSGVGGFSLGLERAGMETAAFCEFDPKCQQVLRKNWPDTPIYNDVRTLTMEQLKNDGIEDIGLICGGFPCQNISIAGKGIGGISGEKSGLWTEYKRIISEVRPKFAVIENVKQLLSRGLSVLLQDLASIGYDATYTTFDSKYFGVPQRRRRVYIIACRDGIRDGSDIFKLEERSTEEHFLKVAAIEKEFAWNFEKGEDIEEAFAYFTRQRSDEFACTGLSSTLAKRDYKSYTDVIVQEGKVRRVSVAERMLLQGLPQDWLEDCGISSSKAYSFNGMTTNVVEHIGGLINEYEKGNI